MTVKPTIRRGLFKAKLNRGCFCKGEVYRFEKVYLHKPIMFFVYPRSSWRWVEFSKKEVKQIFKKIKNVETIKEFLRY